MLGLQRFSGEVDYITVQGGFPEGFAIRAFQFFAACMAQWQGFLLLCCFLSCYMLTSMHVYYQLAITETAK